MMTIPCAGPRRHQAHNHSTAPETCPPLHHHIRGDERSRQPGVQTVGLNIVFSLAVLNEHYLSMLNKHYAHDAQQTVKHYDTGVDAKTFVEKIYTSRTRPRSFPNDLTPA